MALKKNLIREHAGIDGENRVVKNQGPTEISMEISVDLIALHEENDYRAYECDEESIRILAEAIRKQGFLGSLIVCERSGGLNMELQPAVGTRYVLLAGERRLRAIRMLMETGDEMRNRFSKVPCTLKSGFSADPAVRHAQEMAILDGNNINTRGGLSGLPEDGFAVRVTNRYIENLMAGYNLTKTEARKQIKEISGQSATVDRNVRLWEKLTPDLFELMVGTASGVKKLDADSLTRLSTAEQNTLADALIPVARQREELGIRYTRLVNEAVSAALTAEKLTGTDREKAMERLPGLVDDALNTALQEIAAQAEAYRRTKEELERLQTAAASNTSAAEEEIFKKRTAEAVHRSRESKKKKLLEKDRKTYYGYLKRAINSLESLREIEGVTETLVQLESDRGANESIRDALTRIITEAEKLLNAMESRSE